ncbi:CapA family protein [Merismopedia glauca]|uniref:Metallophosphatase n=1 Tax=Merismopedia glauca CCAP 1448/3 TaxID=1296344 RepID=A0A2T1BZL9_9CYAN|nr:CapA family protein [Merismopedia glauca]PSB01475.1 metallophosphatase [Merismopedia glauca CCAP 1448/3]
MTSINRQPFQSTLSKTNLMNYGFKVANWGLLVIVGLTTGLAIQISASSTLPNSLALKNQTSKLAQATDSSITIKAVGDTIPGSNYPINELPSNPKTLFQRIQPDLQGADVLFGNFESTLTNYPKSSKNPNGKSVFAFRTPPEYAYLLKTVGFDVLSVANNHAFDFTQVGFEDTIQNLTKAGIKPVGKKGQIVYLNIKGTSVAFIGFSHTKGHNSVNDLAAGKALVEEANKKAKIVVISVHMGAEGSKALRVRNKSEIFYRENRGNPVLFAHTMVDNGADLILGHGPHVPRAMELYKGKLIAYSLGNFLGYKTLSTKTEKGYSLVLQTQLDAEGNFVNGKILPARLDKDGIPYPDSENRSIQLIRNLTSQDFPNTPLQISAEGELSHK